MQILDATIALATVTAILGATGGALGAQAAARTARPEIERVDFRGVRSVPLQQLRRVVLTRPTSCYLGPLAPLCRVMHTAPFVRKRYLEPGALERDVGRLREFYWRSGFREAQVDTAVRPARHGVAITFDVREGLPTLVDTIAVDQAAPALDTTIIQRAVHLRPGARLDLSSLDTTLATLRDALWDAGYADAIVAPNVYVDDRTHRAKVRIDVNPRWRTRVASIEVQGNRHLSDAALRSALTLRPGGIYGRRDVLESQRHLYESPVVASAFIAIPPRVDSASDSLTQVVVRVQERRPFQFGLEGALNTVDFLEFSGRVGLFALRGGRWQLVMRGMTGNLLAAGLEGDGPFTDVAADDAVDRAFLRPTWQARVEATQLWAGSPRNQLALAAFGQRLSEPGAYVDRAAGFTTAFTREVMDRVPVSIGYRFERAAVDAGDVYFCESFGLCDAAALSVFRDPRRLSAVTLGGWLDRTNNPLAPSRGQTMRLDLEYASSVIGSEYEHFRIDGEAAAYRPFGSSVLAARLRGGWAHAESGVLHPRMLFYSGGGRSVRGYGENQLGPRVLRVSRDDLLTSGCTDATITDGSCDPNAVRSNVFSPRPVGATSLLEGSIELRMRLAGNIGGVLFADGAVAGPGAGSLPAERVATVTPGVGLRYQTPVGALRLDAGWRPARTERLPVVVDSRAADGSTQVTPLVIERQWTSLDDANGRGGALRRVTFHFALGHAF